jgi:hypothetical protein
MKITFLAPLNALNGEGLKDSEDKPFLLRDAAVAALDSVTDETRKLEGQEKYRRGALASRIYGAKEPIALDVDEVKLVKDLIGKVYGPRIVKEAWDLLDPKDSA